MRHVGSPKFPSCDTAEAGIDFPEAGSFSNADYLFRSCMATPSRCPQRHGGFGCSKNHNHLSDVTRGGLIASRVHGRPTQIRPSEPPFRRREFSGSDVRETNAETHSFQGDNGIVSECSPKVGTRSFKLQVWLPCSHSPRLSLDFAIQSMQYSSIPPNGEYQGYQLRTFSNWMVFPGLPQQPLWSCSMDSLAG